MMEYKHAESPRIQRMFNDLANAEALITFEQHLQAEMAKIKEAFKDDRRTTGQARHVLCPLEYQREIRHYVRAICDTRDAEPLE